MVFVSYTGKQDSVSIMHCPKKVMIRRCILAYSDLSNQQVGDIMCRVLVAKALFGTLCPQRTMLRSTKPVITHPSINSVSDHTHSRDTLVVYVAPKLAGPNVQIRLGEVQWWRHDVTVQQQFYANVESSSTLTSAQYVADSMA